MTNRTTYTIKQILVGFIKKLQNFQLNLSKIFFKSWRVPKFTLNFLKNDYFFQNVSNI